ncbi:MAG: AAA family ATPase [Candidatus Gygaella obscura]|nr:AAA family ATPase [Candidatus Gygaella obscura]
MYTQYYSLKERPFNVTSDPSFFFLSTSHKEALAALIYGIKERKGILCLTGEVGTGKTTICKALVKQLDESVKSAFILNPDFSNLQLIGLILSDFGINAKKKDKLSMINELNKFLLNLAKENKNAVLIVDESQNLKPKQLEQIRLLSNLETEKQKLLQIVLVGQPELTEKLNLTSLRQLDQRIMVHYDVKPLEKVDVAAYIHHRLKKAGCLSNVEFDDMSINEIFNYSFGIPRVINIICDLALLAGFVRDTKKISAEIIKEVYNEFKK